MDDDRIDVAAIREALGWTQQQIADYCDTDRSTVSKWEKEPPAKGPALILLRQLRERCEPQRPAAEDDIDFRGASQATAGPAFGRTSSEAGSATVIDPVGEAA